MCVNNHLTTRQTPPLSATNSPPLYRYVSVCLYLYLSLRVFLFVCVSVCLPLPGPLSKFCDSIQCSLLFKPVPIYNSNDHMRPVNPQIDQKQKTYLVPNIKCYIKKKQDI